MPLVFAEESSEKSLNRSSIIELSFRLFLTTLVFIRNFRFETSESKFQSLKGLKDAQRGLQAIGK